MSCSWSSVSAMTNMDKMQPRPASGAAVPKTDYFGFLICFPTCRNRAEEVEMAYKYEHAALPVTRWPVDVLCIHRRLL